MVFHTLLRQQMQRWSTSEQVLGASVSSIPTMILTILFLHTLPRQQRLRQEPSEWGAWAFGIPNPTRILTIDQVSAEVGLRLYNPKDPVTVCAKLDGGVLSRDA